MVASVVVIRLAATTRPRSVGRSRHPRHLSGGLFDGARVCLVVLAVVGSVLAVAPAAAAQGQRFPDVAADHYAFEAVEWAVEAGVTAGYTDGTFKPQRPLIRRHALVFMARYYDEILGADESEDFTRGDMMVLLKAINDGTIRGETPQDAAPGTGGATQGQRFPDVSPGHYAFEAIEWAAEVGVTAGYGDGTFRPAQALSKRHALVFMARYYDEILGAEESEDFARGDMMVLLKAINDGTLRSTDTSSQPTIPPEDGQLVEFAEGESAIRSIPENTPAGINVGAAVSADVGGTLSYNLSGPDAASFTIVAAKGQIRTADGVVYDYEAKNRYSVAVGVVDDSGASGTIDVTILIENLVSACQPLRNLRTNPGDGYLTVRWSPNPQMEGKARVLGYQVEMRLGDGPWANRRTILGRSIGATVYGGLENLARYWFRMRPINTEGECDWSPAFIGIPSTFLIPIIPFDRFGMRPLGSPDRSFRFVTPKRCRYSADGTALDANCQVAATGPQAISITLEFDDPSRGSCDIALAFSSLTAGSFADECFDAGVNTETPFDIGFKMPPAAPQTESEVETPGAPRSKEEFSVLAWGRNDLIPGLHFGCLAPGAVEDFCDDIDADLNVAYRFERDPNTGTLHFVPGEYTYESTGPSTSVLTFKGHTGVTYIFDLDFKPSGHVGVTVSKQSEPISWPGLPYPDLGLEALLPIPNSWWEWAAAETDFAPDDLAGLEAIAPTTRGGIAAERAWGDDRLLRMFMGRISGRWSSPIHYDITRSYDKLGRNRGVLRIDIVDLGTDDPVDDSGTYTFDLIFAADGAALYTLTITKEGETPKVRRGIADFNGDSITLEGIPDELTLPRAPPQAAGQDISGVEIAAAISASVIGGSDVQTFLMSDQGVQPAAYQPGDWLEPKDGSVQRMMIVGASQAAAVSPVASQQQVPATVLHGSSVSPLSQIASTARSALYDPFAASTRQAVTSEPAIMQLLVVCMQKGQAIPIRGSRYFSQPKQAQGPIQTCQRNCALNETSDIQECVWKCEEMG